MIDYYLLEELVTFAKYKTLAKTAEKLNVTQPTVTRGLKKIETDLDLILFERAPNKIMLTELGEKVAKEAKKLMNHHHAFLKTIENYSQESSTIILMSTAPGPLIFLKQQTFNYPIELNEHLINEAEVPMLLEQRQATAIITNQEFFTDQLESYYLGSESLCLNTCHDDIEEESSSITFKQLRGKSFIVLNHIGIWKEVIEQNIPKGHFIYQENLSAFREIINRSNFPYFITNLTSQKPFNPKKNRKIINIEDDSAKQDFYITYLKDEKKKLSHFMKEFSELWPSH